MKFKNKVIWITGASSGIGEALVYTFTREGAKIILSSNDEPELLRVSTQCKNMGGECLVLPFDLLDTEIIKMTVEKAVKEYGSIDVLINNGGISQRSYAHETPLEIDRKIMEIDFFSYIVLTKNVLPYMLKKGSGHIAATSSITGKFGFPLRSAYAAAKHAIQGYFEALSLELRHRNIYITIVYPGRVRTNISFHALTSEGKPYGKMDKGQITGIPVEKCARIYMNAIYKRKKEVLIGGKELIMVYLKRYCPWLFNRMITRVSEI